MTTQPVTPAPDEGPGGPRPWVRPVALVASCLVIGFVGGWIVRGDSGPVTVLAPAQPGDGGGADGGGAATTPGTATGPASTAPSSTSPAAPEPPPDRADIAVGVLNGTSEAGLAARTAGQAESLGYVGVTAGNAPAQTGPSVVYFRSGQGPAARRVARDLQIDAVRPLPGGTALGSEVPEAAEVIVVVGPG